jgi:hypothetical protein
MTHAHMYGQRRVLGHQNNMRDDEGDNMRDDEGHNVRDDEGHNMHGDKGDNPAGPADCC